MALLWQVTVRDDGGGGCCGLEGAVTFVQVLWGKRRGIAVSFVWTKAMSMHSGGRSPRALLGPGLPGGTGQLRAAQFLGTQGISTTLLVVLGFELGAQRAPDHWAFSLALSCFSLQSSL